MQTLYEGVLEKKKQAFSVIKLSLDYLPQILFLQEQVIEALENKETLQPLTSEEYEYILFGNGLIIGAFAQNQLIAVRALLVPPMDDEHLGLDIGLTDEELKQVIYQEISIVHPEFRGNRLQKTLAGIIMNQLKRLDTQYQYVCCTVAPFNIPSLKDKFKQGMEIAALKPKYENRLRYIFVKDLTNDQNAQWTDIQTIPMEDIASQQSLLSKNYRGFEMLSMKGNYYVRYGKR